MTRKGLAVALGCLAAGFVYGALATRLDLPPIRQLRKVEALQRLLSGTAGGNGNHERPTARYQRAPSAEDVAKQMEDLRALGYLSGSERPSGTSGVTIHDPARAAPGVNLAIDGHAPEALLLDMKGDVLHRWSFRFSQAFPGATPPPEAEGVHYWRKVRLLPDGGLLAIYEGQGLVRLDRDSKLLWAHPGGAHHDLEASPDGRIHVLTREPEMIPRINAKRPVLHDHIDVLDASGALLRRVSVLEAIEKSPYHSLLDLGPREGDILHTNSIQLLDGTLADRIPAFRAGNVLVSFPRIDAIAVLDLEAGKVAWALTGMWMYQHQPRLLPSGRILLFDNCGGSPLDGSCPKKPGQLENAPRGRSRVMEIDPVTQLVHWMYEDPRFFSRYNGAAQRLPNGNTLIVESNEGRAFEVTPSHEIVWEYRTPHRAGEDGGMVATLFDLQRIEASAAAALPSRSPAGP